MVIIAEVSERVEIIAGFVSRSVVHVVCGCEIGIWSPQEEVRSVVASVIKCHDEVMKK